MRLLAALGIPTADTAIIDFEDQRVLVVERFDRLWDKRLSSASGTAGGLLPSAVGATNTQVPSGWRPKPF